MLRVLVSAGIVRNPSWTKYSSLPPIEETKDKTEDGVTSKDNQAETTEKKKTPVKIGIPRPLIIKNP